MSLSRGLEKEDKALIKYKSSPQDKMVEDFNGIAVADEHRGFLKLPPVIRLTNGAPHLPMSEAYKELVKLEINETMSMPEKDIVAEFGYVHPKRRQETLEALTKLYREYYPKANYTADEVLLTSGATHALSLSLEMFINPGDRVLVFAPYYAGFENIVALHKGELVTVTTIDTGFKPTASALRNALENNSNIKGIIFNLPNNPTSSDLTRKEMTEIVEVLKEFPNKFIIWDDVYRELFPEHVTPVDVDPVHMKPRCLMINSFSKVIAAPAMRVGIIGGCAAWIKTLSARLGAHIASLNHAQQTELIAGVKFKETKEFKTHLAKRKEAYAENRKFISNELRLLGFSVPEMKEGTSGMFVFASAKNLLGQFIPQSKYLREQVGLTNSHFTADHDISTYFRYEIGVAVLSGKTFGVDEKLGFLRFSCAINFEMLKKALSLINGIFMRNGWHSSHQNYRSDTVFQKSTVQVLDHKQTVGHDAKEAKTFLRDHRFRSLTSKFGIFESGVPVLYHAQKAEVPARSYKSYRDYKGAAPVFKIKA